MTGAEEVGPVLVRAPGKINLVLRVGAEGTDGYHRLATVFQAVSLAEDVCATPAEGISVRTTGRWASLVEDDEANLAHRAATLLAESRNITRGVHLEITKRVPVAGGMAGGSADAAAALLACDLLWRTGLSREDLVRLAAELGADVPFALTGGTALGVGTGGELTPAMARGAHYWVLGMCEEGVSTPAAFAEWDQRNPDPPAEPLVDDEVMTALISGRPEALAGVLVNDLQGPALQLFPGLQDVLDAFAKTSALASVVSGSGPTVAALAQDHSAALDIAEAVRDADVADEVAVVSGPAPGARLLESLHENEA